MNFQRILCPIDLSENSRQAIDLAAALVDAGRGGELVLLYVAIPDLPASSGFAIPSVNAAVDEERRKLETIRPSRSGIAVRHEVVRGEPAESICEFAQKENCDLIVMTTHGRTGLFRLLMGSVAEHVLRHAPCPVLNLRAGTEQPVTAAPV